MTLLAELKRRNVIRMAGLVLIGAWLIAQVAPQARRKRARQRCAPHLRFTRLHLRDAGGAMNLFAGSDYYGSCNLNQWD